MGMVLCDRERNSNATRLAEKNIDHICESVFTFYFYFFVKDVSHIFS